MRWARARLWPWAVTNETLVNGLKNVLPAKERFQGEVSCMNSVWNRAKISSTASSRRFVIILS